MNYSFFKKYPVFWISISLVYSLIFSAIEFSEVPISGLSGFLNLCFQWATVAFCTLGVTGIICANRYVFSITFPLLTLVSTVLCYYKLTLGMSLTPMAIELAMVNDMKTWSEVISPLLISVSAFTLLLSGFPVWWRLKYVRNDHPIDYTFLSISIILIPACISRVKAPVTSRMPYVFYYAFSQYLDNKTAVEENRHTFDKVGASTPVDSLDVIVVIGESLRADHLQLNGYKRATTPLLAKEPNLVSLPEMYTEPYFTHLSVPRIMTRADSIYPDRAYNEQSFITLFKKAGFNTAWISNQDATETYSYFMHEADTLVYSNAAKSLYDFDKWLDMDILPSIDPILAKRKRNLIVIHTIGSHWWYKSHYDDQTAPFKPGIKSKIVSESTQQQMINSYDNTIVETDRFLSALISRLRAKKAIVIFISDHGEALGEEGNFLHGDDYPELHNPAAFVWWSDSYEILNKDKISNLKDNRNKEFWTDAIFHSVLDAANISTTPLDTKQSIFRK